MPLPARSTLTRPLILLTLTVTLTLAPEITVAGEGPASRVTGFVGVVVAGESVAVEPRVEGRVRELLVRPGDRVSAGTPLARLDVSAAVHQLASAKAALADATRRLSRRRRLARLRPDA